MARHYLEKVPLLVWAWLIAWASWPVPGLIPSAGLDPSWAAGLYMAAEQGLDFGTEIVFTYGPLGWLTVPRLYYRGLAIGAFAATATIHLSACWLVTRQAVRAYTLPLGLAIAYLGAASLKTLQSADVVPLVAFLAAVVIVREPRARLARFYPVLAGSLGVIALLIKLNGGVVALVVGGAAILTFPDRLRAIGLYLASALVTFTLVWAATSQSFATIPEFFSSAFEISSGFSSAMGIESLDRKPEYLGVPVAVAFAAFITFYAARSLDTLSSRLILFGITAMMLFAAFKHGFVRHDAHAIIFFAISLIVAIGLSGPSRRLITGTLIVLLFGMLVASTQVPVIAFLNPETQLRSVSTQLEQLSARESVDLQETARQELRASYDIAETMVGAFQGSTLHIEPWETTVAWTYPQATWDPIPVFQPYSAYTDELDDQNADDLASSDAPAFVLRRTLETIDFRHPQFEPPAATLSLICHYREVEADSRWQLLQRTEDRCSQRRHLATVPARGGEIVPVPPAEGDEIIFVTISGVADSLLNKVRTFFFKSDTWFILWEEEVFRLVPGTAENPHVLSAPDSLGYSAPFAIEGPPERISVSTSPIPGELGDPGIRYDFYAVTLQP